MVSPSTQISRKSPKASPTNGIPRIHPNPTRSSLASPRPASAYPPSWPPAATWTMSDAGKTSPMLKKSSSPPCPGPGKTATGASSVGICPPPPLASHAPPSSRCHSKRVRAGRTPTTTEQLRLIIVIEASCAASGNATPPDAFTPRTDNSHEKEAMQWKFSTRW